MEPSQEALIPYKDRLRYRLVGPKAQVTKIEKGKTGIRMHLKLGPVIMIWDAPTPQADVRVGDLLTLYTEILIDAEPDSAPIQ